MELKMRIKKKSPLGWNVYIAAGAVIASIMDNAHGEGVQDCTNTNQWLFLVDDTLIYEGARSAFIVDGSRGVFKVFGDGTPLEYDTSICGLGWDESVETWITRQESPRILKEFIQRSYPSGTRFTLEPEAVDVSYPAEWTGCEPDGVQLFPTSAINTALEELHAMTGRTIVEVDHV